MPSEQACKIDLNKIAEIHTFAGHGHGIAGRKLFDGAGNPTFDLWVPLADAFGIK